MLKIISLLLIVAFMLVFESASSLASDAKIVASQILSGYAIAAGISISLWQISRSRNETGGDLLFEFAIPPAVVIGSSTTVHWLGNSWGNLEGSYKWTVVGASIPIIAGIIIGASLSQTSPDGFEPALFGAAVGYIVGSLGSPAGAVIGYHLSRPEKPAVSILKSTERDSILSFIR